MKRESKREAASRDAILHCIMVAHHGRNENNSTSTTFILAASSHQSHIS
jgi:hypothetical protein